MLSTEGRCLILNTLFENSCGSLCFSLFCSHEASRLGWACVVLFPLLNRNEEWKVFLQSLIIFFPTPKASAASWYRWKRDVLAGGGKTRRVYKDPQQHRETFGSDGSKWPQHHRRGANPGVHQGQILFCADEMMKNKSRGDKQVQSCYSLKNRPSGKMQKPHFVCWVELLMDSLCTKSSVCGRVEVLSKASSAAVLDLYAHGYKEQWFKLTKQPLRWSGFCDIVILYPEPWYPWLWHSTAGDALLSGPDRLSGLLLLYKSNN